MNLQQTAPTIPSPGTLVITEVRVTPQNDRALRAFVSVTFNDCFVVKGLKIIDGQDGTFIAMPSRKRRDDTYQDVAHPITREFRKYLEKVVLEAYVSQNGALVPDHGQPTEVAR